MSDQQKISIPPAELFVYLQQETLDLMAGVTLVAIWVAALVFYNPYDARALVLWPPTVVMTSLACLLALYLNHRHFRLATATLIALLLVADGIALYVSRNGQFLYFVVPIISLANYLVGPLLAVAVSGGVVLLAGLALWVGLPLAEVAGPLALAFVSVTLGWLSSRYLYTTLDWAWASYRRSLEKADEAQRHRAELARTFKSLDEAYSRLSRLNEAFAEAWRAAEEAKSFKAQFAANISHELRTPLYIIAGFSETMLFAPESYHQELPAPYRSDLMEIYNSSRHLLSLIDDVLDLSQIEAGRMGLVKEPTDVAEVIQEAVDLIRGLIDRKGLSLQIQVSPSLPTLMLDRTRIRQVLLNLLNNAVRYTDQGAITVEAVVDGRQLVVSVSDTGLGIPAEHLEKVFASFYQVDTSARRRQGGVGLGLAVSKHFVEMHGGRVWAESQPEVGSRFSFSLPLPAELQATDYTQGRLRRSAPPPLGHADGRQVLLVHPDAATGRVLERHLDGYQVFYAADAAKAEEQLRTLRPRAIIAGEDTVAAALIPGGDQESEPKLPGIPLITCPLPAGPRPALALGVQGYLVKPVARERLLSTLEQCAPQARRVLVVDDDPRVVRLLARMLLSVPGRYQILRAFDGHEALALMRAERPDLILLDLYMPEPDGFTILDHMVHDPALAHIPVIVVSAKGLPEDGVLQLQGPITVTRPGGFTLAELFRYLQALLDASGFPHSSEPANDPAFVRGRSG